MKSIGDFVEDIFSARGGNKLLTALVLIAVALVLVLIAAGGAQFNLADLKKVMPQPRDLATSPIAQDIIKGKEKQPVMPRSGQETNKQDKAPVAPDALISEASPAKAVAAATVPSAPATAPEAARSDMVIIPKIGVSAPIVTPQTNDTARLKKLLDSGAVIYPDSAGPGQTGQTILLGHSAPPGWPKIKHDTIFSRIAELSAGDKIIAVYNDKTYNYSVVNSQIIAKGGDISASAPTASSLVLVTCWPPGRDLKRLVVEAGLDSAE
jgi:LPXTG-site transpeptidase (sortase) family protein